MSDRQIPPHAHESEKALVGSLIMSAEAYDEVGPMLCADQFHSDRNRAVYEAVASLYEEGRRGVDTVMVGEKLNRDGTFGIAGGPSYLVEVLESPGHAGHAAYHAEVVREAYVARQLIYLSDMVRAAAYRGDEKPEAIIRHAEVKLAELGTASTTGGPKPIADIAKRSAEVIIARSENEGDPHAVPTGLKDLDRLILGFRPTDLIVLGARPSMGKTALAMQFAEHAAALNRGSALVFSLEQDELSLGERLITSHTHAQANRIRNGWLNEQERWGVGRTVEELGGLDLYIDDRPALNIGTMRSVARKLRAERGLSMIVVDYVQLAGVSDSRASRERQVAETSMGLKALAKELNVPVVALAQLNRGLESRTDKRPTLSDLRESGQIEQDADVIMFLYRAEQYDPEDSPGEAEIIVAKQRNGPTSAVRCAFRGDRYRFHDLSRTEDRHAVAAGEGEAF
ncbi:MAG: replicative DNA helicase [Planctomycetota bacterium]